MFMGLEKYFLRSDTGSFYREKTFVGTDEEYLEAKKNSSTIFVSNIPLHTREERVWELFLLCGPVRRVIMGVNRNTLRFCGFCFVEFYSMEAASTAVKYLKDFRLDRSPLSIDKDYGFVEGRQYGRGVFGGRVKSDKLYLEDKHQRRDMGDRKRRYDGVSGENRYAQRRGDERIRYYQHDVDSERYEDTDVTKKRYN